MVAHKRDQLTRLKQARDAIRNETVKLKHKGGLIGHKTLLRDFEERQEQVQCIINTRICNLPHGFFILLHLVATVCLQSADMREHLMSLQQHYSQLTLQCDGLRKKIEQTRTLHLQN